MLTITHTQGRSARRRTRLLFPLVAALALAPLGVAGSSTVPGFGTDGTVARLKPSNRPSIEAAFPRESYAPRTRARLVISSRARLASLQVFRAGAETDPILPRDEMRGTPVSRVMPLGKLDGRRVVRILIGDWESGLYYARLSGLGGRVGYAPFVVRPRRLGEHRVAVVLPTFTWQAYNFRDDDHDGNEDTWYAGNDERLARLGRPYENRGVPPHYKRYDQPFLRWLFHTGRGADYLSDSDLHRATGRELSQAYDLIVFPGHHEYVTRQEYDAVTGFRNRGGNLMFLSANNFYWRIDLRGSAIWRNRKWRDLGRPEAALIGVQYRGNDRGTHRSPYTLTDAAPWLVEGTELDKGGRFGIFGIEIDSIAPSSPPGTRVLAWIDDLLGPGFDAHMTYYDTPAGAKVFAAGAFSLAGAAYRQPERALLGNVWAKLSRP